MIKRMSFFKRTFLLISSTVLVTVGVIDFVMIENQKEALMEVMHSKTKTIAKSIALVCADAMVTEDQSFIVEHLQKVLADNDEIDYVLVKENGKESILTTKKNWTLLEIVPDEIAQMHQETETANMLKTILFHKMVYNYTYPVEFTGIKWGWVNIGYSLDEYNQEMQTFYIHMFIVVLLIFFGSIIYSYLLAQWLVDPILRLNEAARAVATGEFDTKVKITSEDEIGQLSRSFNNMVDALEYSDAKLRKANDELEQRVKERTEELNKLNTELDERVKIEVTKQAQQEQILIQQSRFAAMGEMIGNIAHQWRQPLNALSLLIQNIETAHQTKGIDDEYIEHVMTKSDRLIQSMSQTIDDFRNFFKPNKNIEIFSVASSVEVTMDIIKSSLLNNQIELIEEVDEKVSIRGFASEFAQVLLNILGNAKDALMENNLKNPKIYIKVYRDNMDVVIEIIDNGGGIPQNIKQKIFDPYFTTKDEGQGTGIGLYMSKTIIENNMNGSLKVENTDDGSKFIIKVKLVEHDSE